MSVLKRYLLKLSLIFIMLLSIALCIYTLQNYKGSTTSTPNRTEQRNSFAGTRKPGVQFSNPAPSQSAALPNFQMQRGSTASGSDYGPLLIIYSVIFFSLSIAGYYFLAKKKINIHTGNRKIIILTLLCVGLFLRISASLLMEGHPFDVSLFKRWASSAASGFTSFYSNSGSSDYPPLYIYILYLTGKVANIPVLSGYFTLLVKLPSIMADVASGYLIYKLAGRRFSWEVSMLLSAFYLFNPATFINSTFWGQVDSFFTLIVLLAVFMLSEKKTVFSCALFVAAVLMKPQGIIFLPILFFELVRQKSLKNFIKSAVTALCTATVIIIPFSLNKDILWIFKLYSKTVGEYPYASVNAYNFFSMIGANYTKDTSTFFIFSYHTWGMLFIVMITLFTWFIYTKGKSNAFVPAAALILITGVFTFSVGMHERYLFPAAALSLLSFAYLGDKRFLHLSLGFSVTIYLNTHLVLFQTLNGLNQMPFSSVVISMTMIVIISLLNVLLFIYLITIIFDIVIHKNTVTLYT